MKQLKTFSMIGIAIILFAITAFSASASDKVSDFYYVANAQNNAVVYSQKVSDGSAYMFLPSSADLTKFSLQTDAVAPTVTFIADKEITVPFGTEINIPSLFNNPDSLGGKYTLKIKSGNSDAIKVTVMKSANIKSLYILSEDEENKGREWVDTSKSNKAKGNIVFLNTDGSVNCADVMKEIKARGNSTFKDFTKKAYQFKLDKKAALTGDANNAQKKWVLLANASDVTMLHNQLVTTLAKDLKLPYTIDNEPVDLYYDGEYRGTYLLTDKVEVGETNVDIQDLDKIIEADNEGTDAYENPKVVTKTFADHGETNTNKDSKGSYKYVDNLKEPALADGTSHHAYLLELEFIYRYPDEQSGFVTNRGQAVVTKNPEYLTKETGAYISNFFQEFEDAVFSPDGYNEETGKYYYEYCDLDSLVNIYLINEFTKNYDSFRSSAFFYLPEDEDIMYAGPAWDYDLCLGTGYDKNYQIAGNPENLWAATKYMLGTLIEIESFRDAVKATLNSENGEFYKAASNMLGENGNINKYAENIYASQMMNYTVWNILNGKTSAFACTDEPTFENGVKFMYSFAENRLNWLSELTADWNGDDYSAPMDPTRWSSSTTYHEIVNIEAKAATCTEDGNTAGSYCAKCDKVFTQSKVIPAKGHSWKDATCSEPKTCTSCGKIQNPDILGEHVWQEATCLAPKTCKGCGLIDKNSTLADHSWKDATCNTPKTCKVCKITDGEKLKHNYVHDTADNRNSETRMVYKCTHCGNSIFIAVVPKPDYQTGDINMDGKVNAADARAVLRMAAGLDEKPQDDETFALADLNKDNKITAADARLILRKAAKIDE